MSGAAEVTVKHNLGRSNTKQSCRAHIRNDEEDIHQVASTLPGRNKKTKKMQGKMNVELLVSLVSELQFRFLRLQKSRQARKYFLSSSE